MSKILVVDDEAANIKLITLCLVKNFDCTVLTANSSENAFKVIRTELPDIILLDWCMPEMNGIETLIELKKNNVYQDIPVIMTSGVMTESANLDTALQIGAVDFLKKPFDEIELVARVHNMLRISDMYKHICLQNQLLQNQLTSKLTTIQHSSETKKIIKRKMSELKDSLNDNNQQHRDEIFKSIDALLNMDELDWEDFQANFEFIHQDFFKRIKQLYPNLSISELRICAFIRLNMTNKDISKVICISPDSVNTARKRLKRKLELDSGESLTDYLMKL